MHGEWPVPVVLPYRAGTQEELLESHQSVSMCPAGKAAAHPRIHDWQVLAVTTHVAEARDGVQDEKDSEGEEEDLVRDVEIGEVVQDLHSMSAANSLPFCN